MQILGTGLTGLVGRRIVELLPDFNFTSVSRTNGIDVSDINTLEPIFASFKGDWVFHMGAKTDVDGCEKDKELGEEGEAWKVNVIGTQNMATLSKTFNKKLIYVSTDFVFDGEKPEGEGYTEEDKEGPINWYGETKYRGELRIKESGADFLILRIAYPYGVSSAPKKDFVRIVANRLKNGDQVRGITDHIMCPTFIDDIAIALKLLIQKGELGLFHMVGSTPLSPYEAAVAIAKTVGVDPSIIGKTTRGEYFANKALRPCNLYLKNDKIKNLGVRLRTFEEGLASMRESL